MNVINHRHAREACVVVIWSCFIWWLFTCGQVLTQPHFYEASFLLGSDDTCGRLQVVDCSWWRLRPDHFMQLACCTCMTSCDFVLLHGCALQMVLVFLRPVLPASGEIVMLEGLTCVYRSNVDLYFYVMGSQAENEVTSGVESVEVWCKVRVWRVRFQCRWKVKLRSRWGEGVCGKVRSSMIPKVGGAWWM